MGIPLTLILGGARSGKSSYALRLAQERARQVVFVATATAGDADMAARITRHRAERPSWWQTREHTQHVGDALLAEPPQAELLLLDDLTLLVSNVLLQTVGKKDASDLAVQAQIHKAIAAEIEALLTAQQQLGIPWIVVSNEVGWGLVPASPLGRVYRDALGWANRAVAAAAHEVFLMVAGIPLTVKKA